MLLRILCDMDISKKEKKKKEKKGRKGGGGRKKKKQLSAFIDNYVVKDPL